MRPPHSLIVLVLTSLCASCAEAPDWSSPPPDERSKEEKLAEAAQPITVPSGYFRYCSAKSLVNASWSLVADSGNNDPCATALASLGSSGVVYRAGLWDGNGTNTVVARCGHPLVVKQTFRSAAAISDAAAWATGKSHCRFIIAPYELPIFQKPWGTAPTIKSYSGNDFLQSGMSASACHPSGATTLDHSNHEIDYNNHTGYDWWDEDAMDHTHNSTWNVRAVADGVVWFAGGVNLSTGAACSPLSATCMATVYVRHYVGASTSDYHESFFSVYLHMDDIAVSEGTSVSAGDNIGNVGDTGDGSNGEDHLHFGVLRLTNSSTHWHQTGDDLIFDPDGSYDTDWHMQPFIDPFGWRSSACVDPGGQPTDRGALSIDLWISGSTPPDWNHSASGFGWETHDPF